MILNFRTANRDQPPAGRPSQRLARPTPEQTYYLDRLTRLARKAALLGRYLVPTDRRMRLLNHAIFSTYDDCRALGVDVEARAILATVRSDLPTSPPAR
jgi:hypothetical protein